MDENVGGVWEEIWKEIKFNKVKEINNDNNDNRNVSLIIEEYFDDE